MNRLLGPRAVSGSVGEAEMEEQQSEKHEGVPQPSTADDRLRLVIDTIPALVISARPDGSVDFINQRWLEFTGLKVEALRGWGWRAVLHPEDIDLPGLPLAEA
jgi:PAS domain-containing protein